MDLICSFCLIGDSNVKLFVIKCSQYWSCIGPTLYIVMKSDLHTISQLNDMFKYADDTTLLVPEHTGNGIDIEFNRVKAWAAINGLTLNLKKL